MKYLSFLIGTLFITPLITIAANPAVTSFTAGSHSINSGQVASLSWSVSNAGGYSFVIPCTQGLKFKKTDGTIFPCDIAVSSISTSIDGIDLSVWNLSGTTKSFTTRLTPKDAAGADFSLTRQDIQISVAPITHPIESISGLTTSKSSAHYTLSWTGSLIDGVNLSISCAPTIHTTSSSYSSGFLPCGTQVFPSGLPSSGSIDLVFDNSSLTSSDITLTLSPTISPGIYNGIQTESVTVSVASNFIPDAVTTYFASSSTLDRTPETTPVTFSWSTENSTGANMRLSCNEHIAVTINTSGASSTPPCSTSAFIAPLAPSGTGTISFSNNSYANEPITVTLMPMQRSGGYNATKGKDLYFHILPKGTPVIISTATTTTFTQTIPPSNTNSTPTKNTFTKNLARGSQGIEVRALQELLKKDKAIYPEGIVNSMFGPATERAVKRFQTKNNIGNAGTPGYGGVGPKTRALLNSLVK